jgi:hypothetical protein
MAVGYGNFRSGYLPQGFPVGQVGKQVTLTADNTAVPVDKTAILYLGSDNTTAANRTFTLGLGGNLGQQLTIIFTTGSSTTAQLVDTGIQKLQGNWEPTQYEAMTLVWDGTNWIETGRGAISLGAGAVELANLAAGITPSHVVKYAGQTTTLGGAAAEAFTVTGIAATDLAFVQIVNNGTSNVTALQAVCTLNTLTVTFSADPVADTVFNYQILRAAT